MKPEKPSQNEPFYPFISRDCIDVIADGEEDTTVRPLRPVLMKRALEERAKMAAWKKALAEENQSHGQDPENKNAG